MFTVKLFRAGEIKELAVVFIFPITRNIVTQLSTKKVV